MNKKIATKEFIENEILDLIIAFTKNGDSFWSLLIKRLQVHNCTEHEVSNAVVSTIDNLNKELFIADIIQPILEKRMKHIVD